MAQYIGGTADAEFIRDTMATALVAGTNVTKTVDDAGDTITLDSTAAGSDTSLFAYKAADTSRDFGGAGTADPDLTLAATAGTTYIVEGFLRYEASTVGDIKVFLDVDDPSATVPAVVNVMYLGAPRSATGTIGTVNVAVDSADRELGGVGAGNDMGILLQGAVVMGDAAGTVNLMWAQADGDTTPTIVYANSWLRLTPVA